MNHKVFRKLKICSIGVSHCCNASFQRLRVDIFLLILHRLIPNFFQGMQVLDDDMRAIQRNYVKL